MKIGIIVHSHTGNTLSVAQKLQEELVKKGHAVDLEHIKVAGGETPGDMNFQLEDPPEVSGYDAVIFGAPVRGFSISPVIAAYLQQIPTLENKKVVCYVTKQLPSKWTGGNKAVRGMTGICQDKGATVLGTGIISWKSKDKEKQADEFVNSVLTFF